MHHMLRSRGCKVFKVQLYESNARVVLLRILNSDWLQHVRSVWGVYYVRKEIKSWPTFTVASRSEVNSRLRLDLTKGGNNFTLFPNKKQS